MAFYSKNTLAELKRMYEYYRERGSAEMSCTMSFAASMRSALSAMRRQDASWYGVRLTTTPLAEEHCYWDEDVRAEVCVALAMVKAEGKTRGTQAKVMRDVGLLSTDDGKLAPVPRVSVTELEKQMAEGVPNVLPWQMAIGCELLGADIYDTVEAMALKAPEDFQNKYRDTLFAALTEAEKADKNFRENVLVKKWVDYWKGREEELFTGASEQAQIFMRFDLLRAQRERVSSTGLDIMPGKG